MTVPANRLPTSATRRTAWGEASSFSTSSRLSVRLGVAADSLQIARICSTSSRFAGRMTSPSPIALDAELGVEDVAQPVPDEVDAQRGEGQREAGERGQPPRDVEEIAALREHAAPGGRGRLDAEAEERDGRLRHDELGELQARHHDD